MVTIQGPDGAILWMSEKGMEQRVLFKARKAGAHRFCLSNEMSTVSDKVVAFSVIVGDTDELKEGEAGPKRPRDMLQRTVHRIDQGLNEIEELQSFLRTREREHRATIEVANTRVVIWSVLEIIFIVGMAMTSMHYFRKLFSLKRVI
ncbi:unnamed protein product [Phytomonas sp. Hart1]|nr:unnamed protein product [Phytomonas sp. Hart1]|eukprot:CCW70685.1 unnamed protein product [Phytomonas sp. isolate Hart1]